jgi:hypothetical protein
MGLNLGAGLAAADSFFREQDQAKDRAYLQQQRDYQGKVMQAGLDTLGDKTASERAGYQLSAAKNTSGLDMLPDQTAADRLKLKLDAATSTAGLDTLPGATANTLTRQGLESGDLTFQAGQQPKVQQVAAATTDRAIADIPEQEAQRVATNAGKLSERHLAALRELGQSLKSNDKAGALEVANRYSDAEALRTGTKGKRFVNIEMKGDGANGSYHLTAEDGSGVELPAAAVKQALDSAKTGKYSMHQGKEGEVYTFNENTGALERKVAPRADYGDRGTSGNALLDPETLKVMAAQGNTGDTTVFQNLGRGAQGAQNIVNLRKEMIRQATAAGRGGADMAAQNAEYFGTKAGQRAAGTRIANVEMAANEAESLIPLAQQASAEVARSGLLPFGKAQVMFDNQTNDPKLRQFAAANNALVNVYSRAISPSGVPTVADKEHARELISTAIDHKSYMAVTQQMQREITAARAAPQAVRKAFNAAVTGKGEHGATTVPNPITAPAIPAGWSVEVH